MTVPDVTLPLNATRCPECGHRLDDMGGCDSCSADREQTHAGHLESGIADQDCSDCERAVAHWQRAEW